LSLLCEHRTCREVAVKRIRLVGRATGKSRLVDLCWRHYAAFIRLPGSELIEPRDAA
jgi:hypothetical protein